MIRLLGAFGAALAAAAPIVFAQGLSAGCDANELAGGQGGACVIEVNNTPTGDVRTIRPLGADASTRPKVYSGVAGTTPSNIEKIAGVTVIRGAPPATAPAAVAESPKTAPECRYAIRRIRDRRDGERRYNICVDDLAALSQPSSVEALYERLTKTAFLACPADGQRFTKRARIRCARNVLDRAVDQAGIAELALHHAERRSRRYDDRVAIVGPDAG